MIRNADTMKIVTQGNAVNTLQTMVNRMGTFFSRFADLIESRRYDQDQEP